MRPNQEMLVQVVSDVLEKIAFMFVMPDLDDDPQNDNLVQVTGTVHFEGPFSGSISLSVPSAFLPDLANNMLGLEPGQEPDEEQQHDALGELTNVMCGNLVTLLAGDEPVFNLDSPEVITHYQKTDSPGNENTVATAWLPLEIGWVQLSLVLDETTTDMFPTAQLISSDAINLI